MRFPLSDRLDLPCVFEQYLPGRLHPDGRRYLPLIVLRPTAGEGPLLGVVDRHHRVREADAGRRGSARLVFALSQLRLQRGTTRRGLEAEAGVRPGQPSLAPQLFGAVLEVAAWEPGGAELPYESLYTELLLDIGLGSVGLRTSLTAADMAAAVGTARLEPGDFVELNRSRVDILGFEA
jgi:hypothetical protein